MRPAATAVVSLLASLAALAGCGDDGSLSAGDLRAQASAICARASAASDRVAMPSTADEGASFLGSGAASMRLALTQLRTLKPPADLRASYRSALDARAQELALIAQHVTAIDRGEDTIASFRTLQTQLDPLTRMEDAAWRAAQIPACLPR